MVSRNTVEERERRNKERAAKAVEEAATQARLEEERKKVAAEEAEAKRLKAEAAAANKRPRVGGEQCPEVDLTSDKCSEDTNVHIQWIKTGGEQPVDMEEDKNDDNKDPEKSSKKKKKRKDRRSRDKDVSSSILKSGRFTAAATAGKQLNLGEEKKTVAEKRKDEYNNHD
jgi:hypothetical protein